MKTASHHFQNLDVAHGVGGHEGLRLASPAHAGHELTAVLLHLSAGDGVCASEFVGCHFHGQGFVVGKHLGNETNKVGL